MLCDIQLNKDVENSLGLDDAEDNGSNEDTASSPTACTQALYDYWFLEKEFFPYTESWNGFPREHQQRVISEV
jgi:hypothetical protein